MTVQPRQAWSGWWFLIGQKASGFDFFLKYIYRKIKRKKEGSLCDSDKLNSALKGGWKIHPHADVTLHVGIFFLDYC